MGGGGRKLQDRKMTDHMAEKVYDLIMKCLAVAILNFVYGAKKQRFPMVEDQSN